MARLFTAVVLFALACVASAQRFQQIALYTSSSCSGSAYSYDVTPESSCSAAGCSPLGGSTYGTSSCPSNYTSGLPSGTYFAVISYSTSNCAGSVASANFYVPGVCVTLGTASTKYTCTNNIPGITQYTDTACSVSPTSSTPNSCTGSTANICISAADGLVSLPTPHSGATSGLTASISLIAGAIFAVVALTTQ